MKLTFIIPSISLRTNTKRTVKSVVGGQERLDVISRCLLNADRWKTRLPFNIQLVIYFSHPEEQQALYINLLPNSPVLKDELSSIIKLMEIMSKQQTPVSKFERASFSSIVREIAEESKIYYLTLEGSLLSKYILNPSDESSLCFVLGSQHDLSEEQEVSLQDVGIMQISLGSKNYLASHVITVLCSHLFNVL